MKLDWGAFITNPVYQIGGVVAVLLLVGGITAAQKSCGQHHEDVANVEHGKADASAERLKDALQQIEGLHRKVADLEVAGRAYRRAYEGALAKIPAPVEKPPASIEELGTALEEEGLTKGVTVHPGPGISTLSEVDAGLTYLLAQRAKRAASMEEALKACDDLQKAQEATLEAKGLELGKTNEALKASMDEAMHRQAEAQELGKALRVEKRKGWQKYAIGIAGVVVGYAAGRK